ncbi:MAG TPA: Hsp20/alpha crystallin family protein [Thermoleophilaceae bacterium]|nr:Hsp20/alpha crystallin family protein [Thermoleophilaceae bacterium]
MALPVRRSSSPPERWDPFQELGELHTRIGELMEGNWAGLTDRASGIWSPLVDIEETDDAWLVEAELPGVKQEDIDVEVSDSELAISGELKERERKGILRRRTRRTGRFDYRVTLPGEADAERIEASLKEGVLTVRVPKPERARRRRIEIRSA